MMHPSPAIPFGIFFQCWIGSSWLKAAAPHDLTVGAKARSLSHIWAGRPGCVCVLTQDQTFVYLLFCLVPFHGRRFRSCEDKKWKCSCGTIRFFFSFISFRLLLPRSSKGCKSNQILSLTRLKHKKCHHARRVLLFHSPCYYHS